MRGEHIAAALLAGALVSTFPRASSAFCRSTTCDATHEPCATNPSTNCVLEGAPLHWESRCLSFGVQRDGSPKQNIGFRTADKIIQTAFQQWMGANCDGGHPSFRIWDLAAHYGGIICNVPEFNALKPNANVWMFRDDEWPYEGKGQTLALTSTIFEKSSGALLDADVEINSSSTSSIRLTTTGVSSDVEKDLQAIVTHEAGHFLGLGHSNDMTSTMYSLYSPGDLNYRSLSVDDQKGICATYPPDRDVPTCVAPSPAHGFSLYCGGGGDEGTASAKGCSVARASAKELPAGSLVAASAAGLVLGLRRRRRKY